MRPPLLSTLEVRWDCSTERRLPGDGGRPAPRAHKDVGVIQKACEGIALFQGLHPEDRRVLFENMYQLVYGPKELIITQGAHHTRVASARHYRF